jgi:hypothetical protein
MKCIHPILLVTSGPERTWYVSRTAATEGNMMKKGHYLKLL